MDAVKLMKETHQALLACEILEAVDREAKCSSSLGSSGGKNHLQGVLGGLCPNRFTCAVDFENVFDYMPPVMKKSGLHCWQEVRLVPNAYWTGLPSITGSALYELLVLEEGWFRDQIYSAME